MGAAIAGAMAGCQGILLGRTTYEMFEPAEDPGAPFMNDTMKYVVSSTLEKATWRNSEIAGRGERSVTATPRRTQMWMIGAARDARSCMLCR
jgi:dihydrofolate reductase